MTATLASFSPRVLMATFSPGILIGKEKDAACANSSQAHLEVVY